MNTRAVSNIFSMAVDELQEMRPVLSRKTREQNSLKLSIEYER